MNNCLIKEVVKNYSRGIKKCKLYSSSVIYTDNNDKKFVAKENNNNILEIYNYLNSRGFNYLPKLVYLNDKGYIYEYEENTNMPDEQRISDLIKMDALLHNKTVYYKDTSLDEIKEMYEKLNEQINDTFTYYDKLLNEIEQNVYMSPSFYMLARNSSNIFLCLNFCHNSLEKWYEIMSKKRKKRVVLLHNNLDVDHILRSNDNVLISWNKSYRDIPIYDFIKLYKENYSKYDFNELYKEYNKKFPLLEEEKMLLFILLFIPDKIKFNTKEILSTIDVGKLCNYLYITDNLFMENEAKYSKEQDKNINK